MKDSVLVRWRRKAIEVKQMADRSQTPFVKRGLMQVVATYKALAKRAARRDRAHGAVVLPSVTDRYETPANLAALFVPAVVDSAAVLRWSLPRSNGGAALHLSLCTKLWVAGGRNSRPPLSAFCDGVMPALPRS